jgi:cytochrome c oxidase subunit II
MQDAAARLRRDSREDFDRWIQEQSRPAQVSGAASEGQRIFERTACVNCHTVAGTAANGRFGPDLTHLMSRDTIASGAAPNTPENLRRWIQDPGTDQTWIQDAGHGLERSGPDAVTAYLETLR